LLIARSILFFLGAGIDVPGVFPEADPQQSASHADRAPDHVPHRAAALRLDSMLVAAGVGCLAAAANGRGARGVLAASCLAVAIGVLACALSLYLRGTQVAEFARGTLPGWPFATYVLLAIGGLALLGLGLLAGRFPARLDWVVVGADVLFLVRYLWFKDIPPFVYYLLLLAGRRGRCLTAWPAPPARLISHHRARPTLGRPHHVAGTGEGL
jgi:hypothetical protein